MTASQQTQGTKPKEQTQNILKLFVTGFQEKEWRLLHSIIKLSQRRNPALRLLTATEAEDADVIMIDMLDRKAAAWAAEQSWLKDKPVAWVDATSDVPHGHSIIQRPVQWPILPMLLSRVLFTMEGESDNQNKESASQTEAHPSPPKQDRQDRRVLVVDDSLAVRRQLQAFLERKGLQPRLEEDGNAAVQLCQTNHFDCILLDVLMPGIDGYETCRRIKALPSAKECKIIMLTSRTSPFDRIRGKMAGCDAYLTKPVEAEKLYETLQRYL